MAIVYPKPDTLINKPIAGLHLAALTLSSSPAHSAYFKANCSVNAHVNAPPVPIVSIEFLGNRVR